LPGNCGPTLTSRRMKKERADALLVARGLCESREQAKRLILAGEVRSGDHLVDKPSTKLAEDAPLDIKEKPKYVGRGGFKMEGALDSFGISPEGWTCLDIGASTGGFTDCLLQHGAAKVHAIDVGTNQLAYKLRMDPRVVVREQFNARGLEVSTLGEKVRLIVMDLSFISLTKILPAAFGVLEEGGSIVCLIKPQFELEREDIGKGGIVRDPALHERAVAKIQAFVTKELGREWKGVIDSPITGTDGNREFLAWLG
jgi:23S rRNA (cytidine1920-2'-O)/16S rRNA (cytidine1409-2'-O)-methyltransferase